jgi:hypothetical protein
MNAMTTTLDEYYNAFKYGDNTLFSLKAIGGNEIINHLKCPRVLK